MIVDMKLRDTGQVTSFDLPAVPRIGEAIFFPEKDFGVSALDTVRTYVVQEVHWVLPPTASPVLLYLDPHPSEVEDTSPRDDLWDTLGIDPDRINRLEFEEYMDVYDQARSAGPVRPDEEPTP